MESSGKGRETGLMILGDTTLVSDPNAGVDPGLMDIQPTAVFTEDLKHQHLLQFIEQDRQ